MILFSSLHPLQLAQDLYLPLLFPCFPLGFSFDWDDVSNTQDSLSLYLQTHRTLSKLSSWCLKNMEQARHCLSGLTHLLHQHRPRSTLPFYILDLHELTIFDYQKSFFIGEKYHKTNAHQPSCCQVHLLALLLHTQILQFPPQLVLSSKR